MTVRPSSCTRILLAAGVACCLMVAGVAAQSGRASDGKSTAKTFRTAWGEPDLQGLWANRTVTPLERPQAFAGKQTLTPEEKARLEKSSIESTDRDRREGARQTDVARAYN